MRKLASIALLALSLLTVACTESEDVDTDFEAASVDQPELDELDPNADTLTERAETGGQLPVDTVAENPHYRPAHAPNDQPVVDRVGAVGGGTLIATGIVPPSTGVAECPTATTLPSNQPYVGGMDPDIGAVARARYEQIVKIRGLR